MKLFTNKLTMFMVFILITFMTACGSAQPTASSANVPATDKLTSSVDTTKAASTNDSSQGKTFTKAELAKFDGQNGNPAYVAVDGVVYDVSAVKQWAGGKHHGNTAGKDLTKEIKEQSPHGVAVLKGLPVVGKLVN
jgi:predicted heme/steroid binding protein